MNDGKTKASSLVGKFMTKNNRTLCSQHSIIEIHSLNRTVLINERSIWNKGKHRGHKGASDDKLRI